jgi:hypothetical protein
MKNEPAFPQSDPIANEFHKKFGTDRGMTLRDYFAAKAMQGAIAHGLFNTDKASLDYAEYIANIAYVYADAMLKARQE